MFEEDGIAPSGGVAVCDSVTALIPPVVASVKLTEEVFSTTQISVGGGGFRIGLAVRACRLEAS